MNFVSHLFPNLQSGILGVWNLPLRVILLRGEANGIYKIEARECAIVLV